MTMKLLSLNKTFSLTLFASLLTVNSVAAASLEQGKLDRIERDLKIMNNILKTSLAEQTKSRPSIDSVYLANQGMLFTIQQRNGFHFNMHKLPRLPELPELPPLPATSSLSVELTEHQIERIEENAMMAAASAMEIAEVSLDYMSDVDWSSASSSERSAYKAQQSQLRNEKRSLENEARKLEREVRNIERRLRDSRFEEQLEQAESNNKKTAELKDKIDTLTGSLSGVADKLKVNSLKLQKKAQEIKEGQEKKVKARLKLTEKVISESVCDFAPGLRSLQKGQHITFRIEGQPNRLYVFDKASIDKCGDGKLTAIKLMEQATKYEM